MSLIETLIVQLTLLILYIRDNTITCFFIILGICTLSWLIGFQLLFTKTCIYSIFKQLGVGNVRTKRAFIELKRKR